MLSIAGLPAGTYEVTGIVCEGKVRVTEGKEIEVHMTGGKNSEYAVTIKKQ